MRAFRHKKQHTNPSHKRSTHYCGLYVLAYTGAQYIKHTPRSTAPYSCARTWPYTHAVHKTARLERCCSQNRPSRKKVAIFDSLKMDERADGNQKKAFPYIWSNSCIRTPQRFVTDCRFRKSIVSKTSLIAQKSVLTICIILELSLGLSLTGGTSDSKNTFFTSHVSEVE